MSPNIFKVGVSAYENISLSHSSVPSWEVENIDQIDSFISSKMTPISDPELHGLVLTFNIHGQSLHVVGENVVYD